MRSLLNHPDRWLTVDQIGLNQIYSVVCYPVNSLVLRYFIGTQIAQEEVDGLDWYRVPGKRFYYLSKSSKEKILGVFDRVNQVCMIHFPECIDYEYKPYPFVYVYPE